MSKSQTLNDTELVNSLRENFGKLGYGAVSDKPDSYEVQLINALDHIKGDPDFGTSEFSLLRYSARCREAGGPDKLFELWHLVLVAALHVLKFHDRRDAEGAENRKV